MPQRGAILRLHIISVDIVIWIHDSVSVNLHEW